MWSQPRPGIGYASLCSANSSTSPDIGSAKQRRVDGAVEVDGVARGQLHLDLRLGVDAGRVAPPAERRVVVDLALPGDDAGVVDVVADRPGQLVVAGVVEEPLEHRQLGAVLERRVLHDDAVVAAGVTGARVAQRRPADGGVDLVADRALPAACSGMTALYVPSLAPPTLAALSRKGIGDVEPNITL